MIDLVEKRFKVEKGVMFEERAAMIGDRGEMTEEIAGMTEEIGGMIEERGEMTEEIAGMTEERGGMTEVRGAMTEERGGTTEVRGAMTEERRGTTEERRGTTEVRRGLIEERRSMISFHALVLIDSRKRRVRNHIGKIVITRAILTYKILAWMSLKMRPLFSLLVSKAVSRMTIGIIICLLLVLTIILIPTTI